MAGRVAIVGWPQETNVVLAAEWRARGVVADLMSPACATDVLRRGDVAVTRLDVLPTLDGVEEGLDAVAALERRAVRVVNRASALLAAHDKLRTAALLAIAGVPHPRTVYLARSNGEIAIDPPVVVKPRFGSWGADVFRCETALELTRVLNEVRTRPWFRKHGALIQELLPPVGHDLRVVVAGRRVVGAMERVARPGEWRTNVSLGGTRRGVALPGSASALAVRAAAAAGLDFAGVDLFPVAGEHVVLELNGAVEFDDGYDLDGVDIYEAAADALGLPRRARRRRTRGGRACRGFRIARARGPARAAPARAGRGTGRRHRRRHHPRGSVVGRRAMRDSPDAEASARRKAGRMTPTVLPCGRAASSAVSERAAGRSADSWTPAYRLAHCEGYSVDSPAGQHLGYVEELVTPPEGGQPVALRIRTPYEGRRNLISVPIASVCGVIASREQVVIGDLSAIPRRERRTVMADAKAPSRAKRGDVLVVHGHAVGKPERTAEIIEVLGEPEHEHYRVRWEDEHESLVYPSSDVSVRRAKG